MCDCIELMDEQLLPHNTILNITMTLSNAPVRVRVETLKLNKSKRNGPVSLTATYCPFCGVKYGEAPNEPTP